MGQALLGEILPAIIAGAAAAVASLAIILGIKSGALKYVLLGPLQIEPSPKDQTHARALIQAVTHPDPDRPFETEQLAQYYAQVLSQSRISFWFSLIFASLGFLVIIIAGFMHSHTSTGATVAQFIAGIIMDSVSALFLFNQRMLRPP